MLKSQYPGFATGGGPLYAPINLDSDRLVMAQQRRGTSNSAMIMTSYFSHSPGSVGMPFTRPPSDLELLQFNQFMHNYRQQQHFNHQLMVMAHHQQQANALSERAATQMLLTQDSPFMSAHSPRGTAYQQQLSDILRVTEKGGGSAKRPVNLPSIIKQSQTPMMKPFRTKASKAIKCLKQQQREFGMMNSIPQGVGSSTQASSQQSYRFQSALEGNSSFYKRLTSTGDAGMSPLAPQMIQADVDYEKSLQSKSVKPQAPFRFSKHVQQASLLNSQLANLPLDHTASNSMIEGGLGDLENGHQGSPQTAGTNRSNMNLHKQELSSIGRGEGQASLKAIYHSSNPHRSPMTIKDFDQPFPNVLNGTSCLVPVTENEERSIKAQVTLRKLKLDLDFKEERREHHKSAISSKLGTNSKKESQTQINVMFQPETFPEGQPPSTQRINQGTSSQTGHYPINSIVVKERLSILEGMDSSRLIQKEEPHANRFKEIKLPQAAHVGHPLLRKALPARENPMQLTQTQKMQAMVVNFSKYKQLKRFNDSLMRIQQEMVTALKQDKLATKEGRASQATEYEDKKEKAETPGPVTLEINESIATEPKPEEVNIITGEATAELHSDDNSKDGDEKIKEPKVLTDQTPRQAPAQTQPQALQLGKLYAKAAETADTFSYQHHKFVPKKTYMATKKELRSFYQQTMRESEVNDAALDVRQAQLEDRYQSVIDRERNYQEELRRLEQLEKCGVKESPSQKDMQTSIQRQSEGVAEEDQSPTDTAAIELVGPAAHKRLSGEVDLSGGEEGSMQAADVHVVVHQNEYMLRQQERNIAKREKMDTLNNLQAQKRSSTMSGGVGGGSQASSANVPTPQPKFNHVQSTSPPHSPAQNKTTTFSASSNRVIVVHKQHSGKNSPVAQKTVATNPGALANNKRSKSVLENYPIDIYEKLKSNKEEMEKVYKQISLLQKEISSKAQPKSSPRLSQPLPPPVQEASKPKKLPDFPDIPQQVLSVKSTIVRDLEFLKEQKKLAKELKQTQPPHKAPIANPLQFFQTELITLPGTGQDHKVKILDDALSPRTMETPTPSALPQPIMDYSFNLPPQNVARERMHNRHPQTLSDDQQQPQFSLNFPMRNSRLSQAVMASLTVEGNSNRLLPQQSGVVENEASGGQHSPAIILLRQRTHEGMVPNATATFSAMSPAVGSTPANVIQPFTVNPSPTNMQRSSRALLTQFNLDFNSHPAEGDQAQGESIFTEVFEDVDGFIKKYFKKELPFFKDADATTKLVLVRKIVATLEREHFNRQNAKKQGSSQLNSARSNQPTHRSSVPQSKQSPINTHRST